MPPKSENAAAASKLHRKDFPAAQSSRGKLLVDDGNVKYMSRSTRAGWVWMPVSDSVASTDPTLVVQTDALAPMLRCVRQCLVSQASASMWFDVQTPVWRTRVNRLLKLAYHTTVDGDNDVPPTHEKYYRHALRILAHDPPCVVDVSDTERTQQLAEAIDLATLITNEGLQRQDAAVAAARRQ